MDFWTFVVFGFLILQQLVNCCAKPALLFVQQCTIDAHNRVRHEVSEGLIDGQPAAATKLKNLTWSREMNRELQTMWKERRLCNDVVKNQTRRFNVGVRAQDDSWCPSIRAAMKSWTREHTT